MSECDRCQSNRELRQDAEMYRDISSAALAACESRVSALTAALETAERNARVDDHLLSDCEWCVICDQAARDGEINHAPDCPFAVLAVADRQPEGEGQ